MTAHLVCATEIVRQRGQGRVSDFPERLLVLLRADVEGPAPKLVPPLAVPEV